MDYSRGQNRSFNRGEHNSTTHESSDWLADYFRNKPAKEIARKAGVGTRAAEGIKGGRNGMTMAHLVSMCRADADFRREFFRFCGGHLEGDPEFVAGLTLAVQSFMRQAGRASS